MDYVKSCVKSGKDTQFVVEERFPSIIRRLRHEKRISQEALAKVVDVSLGTIQNWEAGNSKPNLVQLLELFRVGGEQLINDVLYLIDYGYVRQINPPSDSDPFKVMSVAGKMTGLFADHVSDGSVSHIEKREQLKHLEEMLPKLSKYRDSIKREIDG